VALEERRADDRLERAHELAHPRLRDTQAHGRATEMQLLRHRDETRAVTSSTDPHAAKTP